VLVRPQPRSSIGGRTERGFPEAQAPDHVLGLERVREELATEVDPRQPRAGEHLVTQHLVPQALDWLQLREEPVAAQVEAIAVQLDGLCEPADGSVRLEDRGALSASGEDVRSRQPCGTGS
jgi:hypothetical protein